MSAYLIARRDGTLVTDALVIEPTDPLGPLMLLALANALRHHANIVGEDNAPGVAARADELHTQAVEWGNVAPDTKPPEVTDRPAIVHLIEGTHGDLSHLLVKDLVKP